MEDKERKLWVKYIKLLVEELDELYPLAHNHGWSSTRVEKGIELRKQLRLNINHDLCEVS